MRWPRLALAVLTLLICGDISHAQVTQVAHSFCATDQACSWGALNTFSAGISLPSLPNGCLSTTSGLVNSQACGLPLTGGTLTGLLNGTIFTASTVITAPQFCIGNSCITAWPASSAPAGTNSLQYSNGAGTALLALPNASAGSWLASTSATTAPAMQTKPVLDARDFGTPNGSNAGVLIQAAHDSAQCPSTGCVIDARGFGATDTIAGLSITKPIQILFGATTFSVTATMAFTSVNYPAVNGAGLGVTKFVWAGNNSTPMFDLNSVFQGTFSDFEAYSPSGVPLTAVFTMEQGSAGLAGARVFTNLAIGGVGGSVVDGFRWQIGSGGDNNNAQDQFNNVSVNNYSNAAWNNSTSGNSQAHKFFGSSCNANTYGKYCYLGQGSFYSYGMFSGGNTVADFDITDNLGVVIDGGFSINSNRFMIESSVLMPVSVTGVFINDTASDGKVVELAGGGPYNFENNFVYGPSTTPFQFYYSLPGLPNSTANNNTFDTSLTNPLTCAGMPTSGECWRGGGNSIIESPGYTNPVAALLPETIVTPLQLGYSGGPDGIPGELDLIGSAYSSSLFPIKVNAAGTSVGLGSNASVNAAGVLGGTAVQIAGCGASTEFPNANGSGCTNILPSAWVPSGLYEVAGGTAIYGTPSNPLQLGTTGATLLVAVLSGYSVDETICDSATGGCPGTSLNTWNYLTHYANGDGYTRIAYAYGITTNAADLFSLGGIGIATIYAFNTGGVTTSGVLDSSAGAASVLSPFQAGSITPTAGDIIVAGWGTQTGTAQANSIAGAGSDTNYSPPLSVLANYTMAGGASFLLDASGGAVNPTWTVTPLSDTPANAAVIAAFKTTASPLLVSTVPIQAPNTPQVGTPSVNQAACIKSAGPPVVIGYCSTVVGSGGACTCN